MSAASPSPRSCSPDEILVQALTDIRGGNPEKAVEPLRAVVQAHPGRGEMHLALADALLCLSCFAEAAAVMETALAWGLDHGEVHRRHAHALVALGRWGEAGAAYRRALVFDPLAFDLHRRHALCLLRVGDQAGVMAVLRRMIVLAPGDAAEALAALSERVRRRDGRWNDALILADRALRLEPGRPDAMAAAGAVHLEQGDTTTAERLFRQALAGMPRLPAAMIGLGRLLLDRNNVDDAWRMARDAVAVDAGNADGWLLLGKTAQARRDIPQAIAAVSRYLALMPEDAGQWAVVGGLYLNGKNQAGALQALCRAVSLNPGYGRAWAFLADLFFRMDRPADADRALRSGIRAGDGDGYPSYCHGLRKAKDRKHAEARRWLRQAIVCAPEEGLYYPCLASTVLQHGSVEAVAAAERLAGWAIKIGGLDVNEARLLLAEMTLLLHDDVAGAVLAYKDLCRDESFRQELEKRWRAGVSLATLLYVQDDRAGAWSILGECADLVSAEHDSLTNARAYLSYLNRLLEWWSFEAPAGMGSAAKKTETLHVIGESHSLAVHGLTLPWRNGTVRAQARWIIGCKMWDLARSTPALPKLRFDAIIRTVPANAPVLMTVGEIDCRLTSGILPHLRRDWTPDRIAAAVEATVTPYLDRMAECAEKGRLDMIISGVPAAHIKPVSCTPVEYAALGGVIRQVNAALKAGAAARGLGFLDVFAMTDSGDGTTQGRWHIDAIHLSPAGVREAFAHYRSHGRCRETTVPHI